MSLLGDLGTAIKNKLGGASVDNTVPRYNGTTCTLQSSEVTISDTNVVTASGGFVGNLTGNATTAATATTATNVSGGKATVHGTGNDYHLGGVEVVGNGPANTVFPTIGFHQPALYASSLQLRGGGDFRFYAQGGGSYANVTANTFIGNLLGNAALTGTPTAPTAAAGTNTTQIATTAFVKAKSEADSIGVNQTWQNVTASRSLGVTYTNSTGKPIFVSFSGAVGDYHTSTFTINGSVVCSFSNNYSHDCATFFEIIPNGATYSITDGRGLAGWWELR